MKSLAFCQGVANELLGKEIQFVSKVETWDGIVDSAVYDDVNDEVNFSLYGNFGEREFYHCNLKVEDCWELLKGGKLQKGEGLELLIVE